MPQYKVKIPKINENKNVSIDVLDKARAAQNAAVSGIANGGTYKSVQKEEGNNLQNPDSETSLLPTPKDTRKNLAKKDSGRTIVFSFTEDVGYFKAKSNDNSAAVSAFKVDEKYRSDPYRLLEVKDKYPISSIQILSRKKGVKKSTNTGYNTILPPYTRFILQSVNLSSSESYQLQKVFKSFRVMFFDENPEVWNFDGMLLNTENHNWSSEFRVLYKEYLRGSQCAKLGAEVFISFEDIVVSGLILNMRTQYGISSPNGVPISFQLLITNEGHSSVSSPIVSTLENNTAFSKTENQASIVFDLIKKSYVGKSRREGGCLTLTKETGEKLDPPLPPLPPL